MKRKPTDLVSVGAVAKALGIDDKTVSRWCRERRLTSTKTLGGHYRITWADVDALVASMRPVRAAA